MGRGGSVLIFLLLLGYTLIPTQDPGHGGRDQIKPPLALALSRIPALP
jgi:hypothetical protein